MGWLRTLVIAGAALAMSGALARAADMPGYPPPPEPPEYRPTFLDPGTGWYLRGDIGAYWGSSPARNRPRRFQIRPTAVSVKA